MTQTGREFVREAGVDPEAWARRYLDALANAEHLPTDADRLEFTAQWFADAMRAAQQAMPKPIIGD